MEYSALFNILQGERINLSDTQRARIAHALNTHPVQSFGKMNETLWETCFDMLESEGIYLSNSKQESIKAQMSALEEPTKAPEEVAPPGIHMTEDQLRRIEEKLTAILSYEPKVGVLGKTGIGKSSLCNALFGQEICPINNVEACTREPKEVFLRIGGKGIKLLDVPGVGENEKRDREYAELYRKLLPEFDLVLWLIKADDRANAKDLEFFQRIIKPHIDQGKPFFFVVSQVDKIDPIREWNDKNHEPGPNQLLNIYRKANYIAEQFSIPSEKVIPVSAIEGYKLKTLVEEIVYALPKEKKVTFFRAVEEDKRSEKATEHVKKSLGEILGEVVVSVVGTVGAFANKLVDLAGKVIEFGGSIANAITTIGDYFKKIFL